MPESLENGPVYPIVRTASGQWASRCDACSYFHWGRSRKETAGKMARHSCAAWRAVLDAHTTRIKE